MSRLEDAGLPAWLDPATGGIVLKHAAPVSRLPGFDDGDVSVQDLFAQRAASLLLQTCQFRQPHRLNPPTGAGRLREGPGGKQRTCWN